MRRLARAGLRVTGRWWWALDTEARTLVVMWAASWFLVTSFTFVYVLVAL